MAGRDNEREDVFSMRQLEDREDTKSFKEHVRYKQHKDKTSENAVVKPWDLSPTQAPSPRDESKA